MKRTDSLLVLLVLLVVVQANTPKPRPSTPYMSGEEVKIQCKTRDGEWGPGPVCADTDAPLSFKYGVDTMLSCSWSLKTKEQYEMISRLIEREDSWECRVEMQKGMNFFVPFSIPVWGIIEPSHLHVDNHLNVIFHAMGGKILGVAAYPIRDNFVVGRKGSLVHIHGPVKWFRGGTFKPYSGSREWDLGGGTCVPIVFAWCAFSITMTAALAFVFYEVYLYPTMKNRLIGKHKKSE